MRMPGVRANPSWLPSGSPNQKPGPSYRKSSPRKKWAPRRLTGLITQMVHTPSMTAVRYSSTGMAERLRCGPPTTRRDAANAKYAMNV